VTLLVHYLRNDPRYSVKGAALQGLGRLASVGANLWPETAVTDVVEVAHSTENPSLLSSALNVLSVLTSSSALTCHGQIHSHSPLLRLAKKCFLSGDTRIAAKSIRILTFVMTYW